MMPALVSATAPTAPDERLGALEARVAELGSLLKTVGQEDKLSLIVFSGSLDRLIAAFVLATGAAAMGMQVSMFFTFWGTSALRRRDVSVKKNFSLSSAVDRDGAVKEFPR